LRCLLNTTKTSSSACTDKTDLATSWTVLGDGGRLTNVLVVTTTEGMLYGILSNTTNLGPTVTFAGVFVVSSASLKQGLVGTASSSDNADLCSDVGWDSLLTTRWKTKTGSSLILIVSNDDGKGTRASGKGTTVPTKGLDVAYNSSFRNHVEWQDVSNVQRGLLSAVDELTSVHTLGTDEQFSVSLIPVSIQKLDLGNRGSSTRVVKDFLDNTADVSLLFSIVQ
jgi:hypothetical protein